MKAETEVAKENNNKDEDEVSGMKILLQELYTTIHKFGVSDIFILQRN